MRSLISQVNEILNNISEENCKPRPEIFEFLDLVHLILEILQYMFILEILRYMFPSFCMIIL